MHIWTESPLQEIWNQLRYLAKPINVQNLLTGTIKSQRKDNWGEEESRIASIEMSSCIRQADEYFQASRVVGLATRPLLLFYGAQCLAKSVVLAKSKVVRLSDLNYHGLSTRAATAIKQRDSLIAYAKSPTAWTLEQEYAVSNKGVFQHLCNVTGDPIPNVGEVVTLKDIIRCLPDLAKMYERHYSESHNSLAIYSSKKEHNEDVPGLYFWSNSYEKIEEIFPEFKDEFERNTLHKHYIGYKRAPLEEIKFGRYQKGTVTGNYLVRPCANGVYSSMPLYFSALFIVGNIVRYKPDFWMRSLDRDPTGSLALIEMLCNLFERRFPNDVLEYIWRERFSYGAPSYIG